MSSSLRLLAFGPIVALGLLLIACADDAQEVEMPDPTSTSDGQGFGGGGDAPAELVAVLADLPVYPLSDARDTGYPEGGSTGGNLLTGFYVSDGATLDNVFSFFSKELAEDGWQEEAEPYKIGSDKAGSQRETMVWSLVRDDTRLAIVIPLTHKDAPDGLRVVQLTLGPKSDPFMSSPVATPIDATPLPTPKPPDATDTSGDQRSGQPTSIEASPASE